MRTTYHKNQREDKRQPTKMTTTTTKMARGEYGDE